MVSHEGRFFSGLGELMVAESNGRELIPIMYHRVELVRDLLRPACAIQIHDPPCLNKLGCNINTNGTKKVYTQPSSL